jgi:uncharacterized membrane protein YvbJ
MFCQDCGAKNKEGARFCLSCGHAFSAEAPSGPSESNARYVSSPHTAPADDLTAEIESAKKRKTATGKKALFVGLAAIVVWLLLLFAIPYVSVNVLILPVVFIVCMIVAIASFASKPGPNDVRDLRKKSEDAKINGDADKAAALAAQADRLAAALNRMR